MKKLLILLVILVALTFGAYKYFYKSDSGPVGPKQEALAVKEGSTSFANNMDAAIKSYYGITEAFAQSDALAVDKASTGFSAALKGVNLSELKADTGIVSTAKDFIKSLLAQADSLPKQKDIEEKRKSLSVISDDLFNLVRTVSYNKDTLYQIHCPMAFNNAGANWLSKDSTIKNPYFGAKMPDCGEVQLSYPNK